MSELGAGYKDTHRNFFEVKNSKRLTHIRLDIYPGTTISRHSLLSFFCQKFALARQKV